MGTTNSAVLTGVVVTTGTWAEGKPLNIRIAVGATFLAVGLAAMGSVNDKLARNFGVLILTVAVLRYAVPIVNKTGITKPMVNPVKPPTTGAGSGRGGSSSGSF